jgi:hypothetical protein
MWNFITPPSLNLFATLSLFFFLAKVERDGRPGCIELALGILGSAAGLAGEKLKKFL